MSLRHPVVGNRHIHKYVHGHMYLNTLTYALHIHGIYIYTYMYIVAHGHIYLNTVIHTLHKHEMYQYT